MSVVALPTEGEPPPENAVPDEAGDPEAEAEVAPAEEEQEPEETEPPFVSIFAILDAIRELPEPVALTHAHLKQIQDELGLITLCWPEINEPQFDEREHYPPAYVWNSDKEKLLLLYAENFRRQFVRRWPNRKALLLAADNELGLKKMVCTSLRATTLPYPAVDTFEKCAAFVGDDITYEPLETPTLIVSGTITLS